jgi:hypothetical protein
MKMDETAKKYDLLELPRRAWLRPDEVGRFLGFSARHIRRLAEKGAFVVFRAGTDKDDRRYPFLRIERESVLRYIQGAVAAYQYETGADCDGPTQGVGDEADP